MKKLIAICLLLLLLPASPALAEGLPEAARALLPSGAVVEADQSAGTFRVLTLSLPETGEALLLTLDTRADAPLSLTTQTAAPARDGATQSREAAETAARSAYPGARVLSCDDTETGAKRLALLTPTLGGTLTIQDDRILSRDLACGAYIRSDRLTLDGALAAMTLLRPDAEFYALELDEDAGVACYEGNARVGGVEYEFELDAKTAKLLEWERD